MSNLRLNFGRFFRAKNGENILYFIYIFTIHFYYSFRYWCFKNLRKKILCKIYKNKNVKRVFLATTFFILVDIKSRVLFNRLALNLVWVFSIIPPSSLPRALRNYYYYYLKKLKTLNKIGRKINLFLKQSPLNFFSLWYLL